MGTCGSAEKKDKPVKLRPHHALCVQFFEGKGYSAEFTESMCRVTERLASEDPVIELTLSADVICSACPHNVGGVCESTAKVALYDAAVLKAVSAEKGSVMPWSRLSSSVHEKIIDCGRLSDICGDCVWAGICGPKA